MVKLTMKRYGNTSISTHSTVSEAAEYACTDMEFNVAVPVCIWRNGVCIWQTQEPLEESYKELGKLLK